MRVLFWLFVSFCCAGDCLQHNKGVARQGDFGFSRLLLIILIVIGILYILFDIQRSLHGDLLKISVTCMRLIILFNF